eukprot:IDg9953t1
MTNAVDFDVADSSGRSGTPCKKAKKDRVAEFDSVLDAIRDSDGAANERDKMAKYTFLGMLSIPRESEVQHRKITQYYSAVHPITARLGTESSFTGIIHRLHHRNRNTAHLQCLVLYIFNGRAHFTDKG